MQRDFNALLRAQWKQQKFLCVGIDPVLEKLPEHFRVLPVREALTVFGCEIVDATKSVAGSYKPNTAFFEAYGGEGFAALKAITAHINMVAPSIPVIADAKRADIGTTNEGYVRAIYDYLGADAVTLHPYLGGESLAPFLDRTDKGVFILARTSNPSAGEIQDLLVDGEPVYMHVARKATGEWNRNRNVGLVTGATYPQEIAAIRATAGDAPFLIPGVGAQGGDLEQAVQAARTSDGGFLLSVSRAIIYASTGEDYGAAVAREAEKYHSAILAALL